MSQVSEDFVRAARRTDPARQRWSAKLEEEWGKGGGGADRLRRGPRGASESCPDV